MRRVLLAVLAVASTGCAPLTVTYHSDPEGATLYANNEGRNFGQTPVTLNYKPSQAFLSGQRCETFQGSMVRWPSGATAELPSLVLCPENGRRQQYTFVRPTSAPGVETDVAANYQRLLAEQARIAGEQAARAARAAAAPPPPPPPLALYGRAIETRIDGEFEGWDGDTVFVLQNGQIWKQRSYSYHYHYAYMPRVVIYNTSTGYEMKVDGVAPTVKVEQLR